MPRSGASHKVYVERGDNRVFAGALEWPGWCRSGRDEDRALDALVAYGPRFAHVVRRKVPGFRAPEDAAELIVTERLRGDATTDFGAPSIAPSSDGRRIDPRELGRLASFLKACWAAFDRAVDASTGETLRKGPRGGGREIDSIVEHVVGAEGAYIRRLAAKPPAGAGSEGTARGEMREAVLEALSRAVTDGLPAKGPRGGTIWMPRYFVRRVAWHALDHAWEIEDRSSS